MAVGNSLTAKKQNSDRVEFEVAGEKITLTPQIVRDYLSAAIRIVSPCRRL